MEKEYTKEYLEKEFKTRFDNYTISRGDYCSLPCSMEAQDWTDEQMQALADAIGCEMTLYSFDERSPYYKDYKDEVFWRVMKSCAVHMGMVYTEDLEDE